MIRKRVPVAVAVLLAGLTTFCVWAVVQTAQAVAQPIPARDVVKLREQLGREVTVQGRIDRTGQSRSGHQFLNFASSELTAVCLPEHVGNFRGGKPADLYRHEDVELTGRVELYRNKVQIQLIDPSQIHIVSLPDKPGAKGVDLKQIGPQTWVSPAGLRYHGRDPEGLTRLQHICRHLRDEPERDGPHGVFDGSREVAFAVIDEAWQLAQKRQLRPRREGGRSSYTVEMGRRIGYLGGHTGAIRSHPPLSRVFIVFVSGTNQVITAFPK